MESIIGKKYKPNDNSYALCLSDNKYEERKEYYLAGIQGDKEAQIVEIQTDPFLVTYNTNFSIGKQDYFIIVKDKKKKSHFILYDKECVVK